MKHLIIIIVIGLCSCLPAQGAHGCNLSDKLKSTLASSWNRLNSGLDYLLLPTLYKAKKIGLKPEYLPTPEPDFFSVNQLASLTQIVSPFSGKRKTCASGFFIGRHNDYFVGVTNSHVTEENRTLGVRPSNLFLNRVSSYYYYTREYSGAHVVIKWNNAWHRSINSLSDVALFVVPASVLGKWADMISPFAIKTPNEKETATIISAENDTMSSGYFFRYGKGEGHLVYAGHARGDSGSPIVWFDDKRKEHFVFAIHSYGFLHRELSSGYLLDAALRSGILDSIRNPTNRKNPFKLVSPTMDSQIEAVHEVITRLH